LKGNGTLLDSRGRWRYSSEGTFKIGAVYLSITRKIHPVGGPEVTLSMACRNNSESEIDSAQVPSGTTTDDSFLVRTEPSNEFPFGRYRPFKKNCGMATTSTTTTQPDSFNTLQSLSKVNTQTQTGHSDLVVLLGDHC
jgi:hypothetical protein